MLEANVDRILRSIGPSDIVVDIGGWAKPFTRANYVVDLMAYETRGVFGRVGDDREHFTRDTWLQLDICTSPLPFADQSIDYVVCSHTLEDIRDPIRVCKEINRIARRGYIETPSRDMESIRNLERRGYAGYCHHHWLVEMVANEVTFRFKTPLMNSSWRYTLPRSYMKSLRPEERVVFLFWEGSFGYREVVQLSEDKIAQELEDFVRRRRVYPRWRYALERLRPNPRARAKRILRQTKHFRKLADRLLGRRIFIPDEDGFWNSLPEHESR